MKLSHVFAAASLAVAALGVGSSAEAQGWGPGYHHGYDDGYRGWHHRPYYAHGYGDYGRGYGWHGDWRGRYHGGHCWTEWHYRHRVRVCD